MSNNISFNPVSKLAELTVPHPKPAREYMPEWYSSMPAFQTAKPSYDKVGGTSNRTMKMCMPFGDALHMGYIQETWQEINISLDKLQDNTFEFNYFFPTQPEIMGMRNSNPHKYPIPQDYYQFELSWHPAWMPELPKGYSALITHPLNREDLPFRTFTGIVDSDTFTQTQEGSNLPFLMKKDFTGIIKQGTPMYQIIPFKREEWFSEANKYNEEEQIKAVQKLRQHFWGGYKKTHWQKKKFN